MVKVQNWPVKDLDPGRGWIHCVYGPCDAWKVDISDPKVLFNS